MWTHLHTCYFCVSILHEADWGDHPSIDVIELSARDERISVLGCPWVTNIEYWAAYSRSPTGWAPCTFTEKQHFQPFARQIITLKLILYSWLFCSVYIQVIPQKKFLIVQSEAVVCWALAQVLQWILLSKSSLKTIGGHQLLCHLRKTALFGQFFYSKNRKKLFKVVEPQNNWWLTPPPFVHLCKSDFLDKDSFLHQFVVLAHLHIH